MVATRLSADAARAEAKDALAEGRRKADGGQDRHVVGRRAVLALQRKAGNSAVNALFAARLKWPGEQARIDIDAGIRELRRDEPTLGKVEAGLKAAQSLGIPVDLEGVRPPPAALAVTMSGFGPGSVAPKKAVPPPKRVPAVSPLGKAAAKAPKPDPGGKGTGGGPAMAIDGGGAAPTMAPPLAPDQLLQPPVAPTAVAPEDDPAFSKVKGNVKKFAKAKKAHPPAASKAKEAQNAAVPPTDDVPGQAKAAKVDTMDAQRPGSFDKKAFIAAVKAAIEAKSPKNLKEASDYKASGKAKEIKGEITGMVTEGKEGQTKDIEAATEAPPDTSKAVAKPVTPMGPEQPGQAVAIPAAGAVPKPAPPEQLNLEAGKAQANDEMASADVTEKQLEESNEPEFQQGLEAKKEAAAHADTAPGEFRQHEQGVIDQNKSEAAAETTGAVAGMQGSKASALAKLVGQKSKAKTKDEAKRAEVTAKIQSIFAATEADVKKILDGIDPKVDAAFTQGEAGARAEFETYVSAKMYAYKKDRYGGWLGPMRWLRDKFKGMPSKVNEFYTAGRELYLKKMDVVISKVADIVGNDLTAAKLRIATGRTEITTYVKSLPKDLQKVGSEASKEIGDRFEQLENDVNDKQEAVVDTLATKYVEARKGLDERIEALQAENRGLIDKAIGAIKAIINTIRELAAMLKNVLSRVAGVVGQIIRAPVKFLGNLIDGVKGGILKFKDNFLTHLRNGLMSWLFGALAEGGVELPDSFDLKGIIKLLASIFGLTWKNIRNRLVKQIGEKAMQAVEKGVQIFQVFKDQGVAGLWQMLLEKLGDIKEMILDQVKDFVITRIITAGITWLIGLLNPAAAFIKACKLIYDVVMFFINNASRIAKFVNTILDSVSDIAKGNVSSVVNKVEDALGQMVPIIIGFLASLVGLGGVGEKVRKIVTTLQKPVTQAIDFVISTGLKLAGPIIRGIKGVSGKVKAKVEQGKAYVKGKVEAGKKYVKGKVEKGKAYVKAKVDAGKKWVKGKVEKGKAWAKDKVGGTDTRTEKEKQTAVHQAVLDAEALMTQKDITPKQVTKDLKTIRKKYQLAAMIMEDLGEEKYRVGAKINPAEWTQPTILQGIQNKEAEDLIAKAQKAEPTITALLRSLLAACRGSLQGYEYRIKTNKSLTDKLSRDADKLAPHKVKEVGSKISDVLRYTIQLPIEVYADGHNQVLEKLKAAGQEVINDEKGRPKDKNFWWQEGKIGTPDERAYRGYNVQLRSPEGQAWELQFHTKESLKFKGKGSHKEYEEIRKIDADEKDGVVTAEQKARRTELKERLLVMARALPVPPGVMPDTADEIV